MLDLQEISHWMLDRLSGADVLEVWIFGSATNVDRQPKDVDVFVKCRDGNFGSIPAIRATLEGGFLARFGVPLHLLFLGKSESAEVDVFLSNALTNAIRVM